MKAYWKDRLFVAGLASSLLSASIVGVTGVNYVRHHDIERTEIVEGYELKTRSRMDGIASYTTIKLVDGKPIYLERHDPYQGCSKYIDLDLDGEIDVVYRDEGFFSWNKGRVYKRDKKLEGNEDIFRKAEEELRKETKRFEKE